MAVTDAHAPGNPNKSQQAVLEEVRNAAASGNRALALHLARSAVESGHRHPEIYEIWATELVRDGRGEDALEVLKRACADAQSDFTTLYRIGRLLIRLRKPLEALDALNAAVAVNPDLAQAHHERGVALGMLGEVAMMRHAYERTIEIQPRHSDALAGLALIAARSGETDKARHYAATALDATATCTPALASLVVADVVDGNLTAAKARLQSVLADRNSLYDTRIDVALDDAAVALERGGNHSLAFEIIAVAAERRRTRQLPSMTGPRAIAAVRERATHVAECGAWTVSPASRADMASATGHVFLVGFMRSGTTLLEAILASHRDICAVDEREFLSEAAREFLFSADGIHRLAGLDDDELSYWRRSYWDSVRRAGVDPSDKVFINKLPFNLLRLPLIATLFPEAQIILALRDPRDVVFSCFRRRFDPNHVTFEFLRLEDCARFFDATMTLVQVCRENIPMRILEHRYEDTIADFEGSIKSVCRFLGIEWLREMRNFATASNVIDPRSQSASQIRRGLYNGGIGQWRPYRAQLAPIFPILQPWIERFRYAAD